MRLLRGLVCIVILFACRQSGQGQLVVEQYENVPALLRIGPEPDRQIQMTERGHTLVLPDDTLKVSGLAVLFERGRIPVEAGYRPDSGSFDAEALIRGVGILHVASGNPLDFFFADSTMRWVAKHIQTVLEAQNLKGVPVFFCGLSLGGTRALKLAQFLVEHRTEFWLSPLAVAVVDAPLDMERFWYTAQSAAELGFHAAAADEGRWVTYLLRSNLGGSPRESYDAFVNYSVYTHSAPGRGRAGLLKDVSIRAYHEPDVNWWIHNRRKGYYDMNSLDLAALINELRIQGNESAELITTHQQREGYSEGSSPHTWSIVDNADLIKWLLSREK